MEERKEITAMAKKRFLETGKIVGTHGVRGEVRVDPWSDSPEFVKQLKHLYFDGGKVRVPLASSRVHKNQVLLKLEGVDTVEQADALRGKVLWLDREEVQLPEGVVFQQDLIGLRAVDGITGAVYGTLEEVLPTGANDVYRIRGAGGKEYLFPAVAHMIQKTDVERGVIELLPIPGIFDDGGEEA